MAEDMAWADEADAHCLEGFLHARLTGECLSLYKGGFHKQAAMEAMKQVELALRDKTGGPSEVSGVRLVRMAFDDDRGFYLHLRLDPEQQEAGRLLFEGAFKYYRNYAAHDGTKISPTIAVRVLILASELLDMLGASSRRLGGREGLEQFIRSTFGDGDMLVRALRALDGEWFGDDVVDGFFESLRKAGVSDDQFFAVVETGLIEVDEGPTMDPEWDTVTRFQLTADGARVIEWLEGPEASASRS